MTCVGADGRIDPTFENTLLIFIEKLPDSRQQQ